MEYRGPFAGSSGDHMLVRRALQSATHDAVSTSVTPTVILRRALARYDAALEVTPYRTKAVTSMCVSAAGDALAQGSDGFDAMRNARQAAWGLLMGPVSHNIFNFLSRLPPVGVLPASVVGVAVDQACFAVPIHAGYFAWISLASSGFTRSIADVKAEVNDKLWPGVRAGLAVWPATIYFNVRFVPLKYRVLFTNVVGVGYGMLMSRMANRTPL